MSVKLRLSRVGAKKNPFYRVVVTDSRSPRDGKFIEHVGIYDPNRDPVEIRFDMERVKHWLSVGATAVGHRLGAAQGRREGPGRRRQGVIPPMSKDHPELQELVKFIAKSLVDKPDEVTSKRWKRTAPPSSSSPSPKTISARSSASRAAPPAHLRSMLSAAASKVRTRALS